MKPHLPPSISTITSQLMNPSVIISTYNNPEWLEKVLIGYEHQSYSSFEIIIADDGSEQPTFDLLDKFKQRSKLDIKHVWHPDNGFQKCAILNKATIATDGDYLIFTDGDCIPRPNFIQTHTEYAEDKYFLSGGYCKLPMELSKMITPEDISNGNAFNYEWLSKNGLNNFSSKLKLSLTHPWNQLADKITTTKPSWNGCNASTWKKYILEVNGHNEAMHYGGEDRELGLRLLNLNITAKQLRHRAVLVHLDHARGYKTQEILDKNMAIRKATKKSRITWTPHGIIKDEKPS